MALDERYMISMPLNQYFVDKDTGLPLAGGTLTFYRDSARNTAKTVYQLTGAPGSYTYSPLPNPITLSSVGTVENAGGDNEIIYFYPYDDRGNIDLYYVVCRSSIGVDQFTREAWPNLVLGNDPSQDNFPINNQISNPQFAQVFINDTNTVAYTVAGSEVVFKFAPDWDFVINGTGTVTVTRTAAAGSSGIPTHPPYYLTVDVPSGITYCYLRQRMAINSGLWGSTVDTDVYLSTLLVGRNQNAGTASISMFYLPSNGGSAQQILNGGVIQGEWTVIKSGSADRIQESADANTGTSGYVDIYISFPANTLIDLSSIQVVPVGSSLGFDNVQYDERSTNRETAYLTDYYSPLLQAKRIPSLLQGWDFPLNPAQWGATGTLLATPAIASYIWDQTIAKDTANNTTYARNASTGGLQFTTVTTAAHSVSMVQFLSLPEVREIIGNKLAVNVNAFRTTAGGAVTMRVYLYRGTNAAAYPSLAANQFIATVSNAGVATAPFTGWTEIARGGLDTATATVNTITNIASLRNDNYDYKFTNWEITENSELIDTEKFAILITFAYSVAATVFTVNSVSLTNNNIPARPGLQSEAEVLVDCQSYYRKSFAQGTIPDPLTPTQVGAWQQAAIGVGAPNTPDVVFANIRWWPPMHSAPTVTRYNVVTASDANVRNLTAIADAATTGTQDITKDGFYINYTDPGWTAGQRIAIQWSADSRLGK